MSKCNLLRPLGTGTSGYSGGTFWLFSQYTEDLTRGAAFGDAYRVIPSKFAAMDLSFSGLSDSTVAEKFQNRLEHSVAYWRHELANQNTLPKFNADCFSALFWTVMNETFGVCSDPSKIKWIGESDVVGTSEVDGDTYSEIYCFVPTSAAPRSYIIDSNRSIKDFESGATSPDTFSICYGWTAQTYPQLTGGTGSSAGTSATGVSGTGNLAATPLPIPATFSVPRIIQPSEVSVMGDTLESLHNYFCNNVGNVNWDEIQNPGESFNINTVAVFYDVVAKDENGDYKCIYANVPLGMYFTGQVDGANLKNSVTKYITNDDIYGQGTSYGLRITTKYTSAPATVGTDSEDSVTAHVIGYGSVNWSDAAAVIDSMRSAADAVIASIEAGSSRHNELMNHLSQFRDKTANVPYIRRVGDKDYWFVNGRNTGRTVGDAVNTSDIEQIIINMLPDILNDATDQSTDPDATRYIQHIPHNKYTGNSNITSIDDLEDYQDLDGIKCRGMFSGCSALTRIPRLEVSNSTDMSSMFYGCSSITSIDLRDSWQCTTFNSAFSGCSKATSIHIDGTSATNYGHAFDGCNKLANLFIDNLKGYSTESAANANTIDLQNTIVSEASVKRIIEGVQDSGVNMNGEPSSYISLSLPTGMSNSFNLQCACDIALNNRGVKVMLH